MHRHGDTVQIEKNNIKTEIDRVIANPLLVCTEVYAQTPPLFIHFMCVCSFTVCVSGKLKFKGPWLALDFFVGWGRRTEREEALTHALIHSLARTFNESLNLAFRFWVLISHLFSFSFFLSFLHTSFFHSPYSSVFFSPPPHTTSLSPLLPPTLPSFEWYICSLLHSTTAYFQVSHTRKNTLPHIIHTETKPWPTTRNTRSILSAAPAPSRRTRCSRRSWSPTEARSPSAFSVPPTSLPWRLLPCSRTRTDSACTATRYDYKATFFFLGGHIIFGGCRECCCFVVELLVCPNNTPWVVDVCQTKQTPKHNMAIISVQAMWG